MADAKDRKKVAIDLDEVLCHFVPAITKYFNGLPTKEIGTPDILLSDYDGRNWAEVWGTTIDGVNQIILEFAKTEEFKCLEPVKGAFESILSMHETWKFDFYVITARALLLKDTTMKWLAQFFPGKEFEGTIFTQVIFANSHGQDSKQPISSKVEQCKIIGCRALIDDLPLNFENCRENSIITIAFNFYGLYGWTESLQKEFRSDYSARSWADVKDILINYL
jgi:5'(3')-deoxyribonucleotidase